MTRISKQTLIKQAYFVLIMTAILSIFCVFTGTDVYAAKDINSINGGNSTSQSSQSTNKNETKSAADGIADAWKNASPDNQDMAEAAKFASPFVKGVNFCICCVLAVFSVLLAAVTTLDLLYLAVPPVRKFLCAEQPAAAGGMGGGMGMGMGGMGMRGGMGMGGAQPSQSGIGRFVSDEAVAALSEATANAGGGGGMGMGGMGMGMGMGGMGMGGAAQAQPKTKSVIFTYLKKRAFALIMFALCVVLLTSTLFTDIGLYIGQWIIDTVGGFFSF